MRTVKCLVWDLDDTLWRGTLLEGDDLVVDTAARVLVIELDRRGILQSIASRNDPDLATAALRRSGMADYFVAPRIGWDAKSASIRGIAEELRIATDAMAFVDDQPFDRDEVRSELPEVRCYPAEAIPTMATLAEFSPEVITEEAASRRTLYQTEHRRRRDEDRHEGPKGAFLAGLGLVLTVWRARPADLARAAELTVRTHQLNTTGRTYSSAELAELAADPDHLVLLARLDDRYGSYGTIGLALVQRGPAWRLKLLLMSCRVLARGVGGALLREVVELANAASAPVEADLVANDRNRMMLVTLRLAGFGPLADDPSVLRRPPSPMPALAHVEVVHER